MIFAIFLPPTLVNTGQWSVKINHKLSFENGHDPRITDSFDFDGLHVIHANDFTDRASMWCL